MDLVLTEAYHNYKISLYIQISVKAASAIPVKTVFLCYCGDDDT